ncbi:unnamed protein product [Blepharisma stoltei]|uniref:N-acetyltransferase domain-containing protein n=1 Tax=Blepharisma stoltei TaxID=1481888 RepID=A0AAU9IBZ4_9CILI|nr:unnamed protein product [Blepharisma stoltei]
MQSNLTFHNISLSNVTEMRKIQSYSNVTHDFWYEYHCMTDWKEYSFLCYLDDICVGSLVARFKNKTSNLYIMDFDVALDYKRMKIGSRMMEHLKEIASKISKISSITLHVWTSNEAAVNFYKNQNFEIVAQLDNYYYEYQPTTAFVCEFKIKRDTNCLKDCLLFWSNEESQSL